MSQVQPVRFAVAGLGGYAAYVTERLLDPSGRNPTAKLVAVCDPDLMQFPRRVQELAARGIPTLQNCQQLFDLDIEAIWLPLPIDLHRSYTESALSAGKAVLCEKPAAATVDDIDAMIAARESSGLPVLVGFQDLYQPNVALLKQRLLDGEFGTPLNATVLGCWPRGDAYFKRNEWAGRLMRNGRWVLDSPAANALAHFLHLALYLLGSKIEEAASPLSVSAELYRANEIETYDTCSLRLGLPGDVPLYVAYTHACSEMVEPMITIETDRGVIRYHAYRSIDIRMNDGSRQRMVLSDKPHAQMLQTFQQCLRDPSAGALGATLEMSRAHVVAINVASEAAPVVDVPSQHVQHIHDSEDNVVRTIDQIVAAVKASAERKCMLHETGMLPWARTAHTKHVGHYAHFNGPCHMRAGAPRVTVQIDKHVADAPLRQAAALK
jgi:predicted dehydrogenase